MGCRGIAPLPAPNLGAIAIGNFAVYQISPSRCHTTAQMLRMKSLKYADS
jgi:hypothetical protein